MNIEILINLADTNRKTIDGKLYFMSSSKFDSPIGTVLCFRDYTKCGLTYSKAATTFKLNGKVISKSNLIERLKEIS